MVTKTYGAVGFLDYQAEIPVGQAKMVVNFTGGAITGCGIAPAEYVTSDTLTQNIIEHSRQFRSGRIILLRTVKHQDDAADRSTDAGHQSTANEHKEVTVEVSCMDDAKAYLIKEFGIASRDLRSAKQIMDAATSRGITFTGI